MAKGGNIEKRTRKHRKMEEFVELLKITYPEYKLIGNNHGLSRVKMTSLDGDLNIRSTFDMRNGVDSIETLILPPPSPPAQPKPPKQPRIIQHQQSSIQPQANGSDYNNPKYTMEIRGNLAVICEQYIHREKHVVMERTINDRTVGKITRELRSYISKGEIAWWLIRSNKIFLDEKNHIMIRKNATFLVPTNPVLKHHKTISKSHGCRRTIGEAATSCREVYIARKLELIRSTFAAKSIWKIYKMTCLYDITYKVARRKAERFFSDFRA